MSQLDYTKPYIKYPYDVVTGQIVACQYVKLACKRFLSWFNREDIEFSYKNVEKAINFIEKLKHFKGQFSGKKFYLEPWQQFFIAGIFGFFYTNTDERVTRHVILDCARKQGKSAIASAIGLYIMICESEGQVEVLNVANTREQARILFDMAVNMAKKIDPKHKHLKPTINKLKYLKNDSYFKVLASDSATLDGYGAQLFIEDEMHSAPNTKLYDVLSSSQASAKNPLSLICTTAGFNLNYPYYTDFRSSLISVLEGTQENDSLFGVIYTLDDGDDYTDENLWIKCSPNLGVTLQKNYIRDRIKQAQNSNALMTDLLTKTFNLWVGNSDIWIKDEIVFKSMEKVDINKMKGQACWAGVDLSSVSDLTSISILWPPDEFRDYYPDKYVFYSIPYIPGQAIDESSNRDFYKRCIEAGHLRDTKTKTVDYDFVLKDIIELSKNLIINKIAEDQWNATYFHRHATDEGLDMETFSQSLSSFNRPTKFLEKLLIENQVVIDANVVTRWCFQNCQLKTDHCENQKPVKADDDKNRKIDVVISMIEALGIWLNETNQWFGPTDQEIENKQNQK